MEHGLLIENLLDLAHAPFTHTATFARGKKFYYLQDDEQEVMRIKGIPLRTIDTAGNSIQLVDRSFYERRVARAGRGQVPPARGAGGQLGPVPHRHELPAAGKCTACRSPLLQPP